VFIAVNAGAGENTPHEVFLAWFGDVIDILTREA